MSTSVVSQNDALWSSEAYDSALGASAQVVKGSSASVYQVEVDNTANTGAASYVKMYNIAAASVTVGTSVPLAVFPAPAGAKVSYTFPVSKGASFGSAVSWACVTAGGTAGTSAPSNSVIVRALFS